MTSVLFTLGRYESLYLGFGFVWTYFFFAAIGTTTISGCVVYYFMDEDTP